MKTVALMNDCSVPIHKVVVFASGGYAYPTISMLLEQQKLAGVVLPDVTEYALNTGEIIALARQLQAASVPVVFCKKEQLACLSEQLSLWRAEIALIVSFPYLLPVKIFQTLPWGAVNVHGSPLPAYRGPAPLYWQIRNSEVASALVLHCAEEKVDSGAILLRHDIEIDPNDTVQCLSNKMAHASAQLISDFLSGIDSEGKLPEKKEQPVVHEHSKLPGKSYARRPGPEENHIHFTSMTALEISALCRASNAQPNGAWCHIHKVPIHVMQAMPVERQHYGVEPATILAIGEAEGLVVSTLEGALRLDILACADGVFSGFTFAERFQLDVGMTLSSVSSQTLNLET